jgi:hypothetical protein
VLFPSACQKRKEQLTYSRDLSLQACNKCQNLDGDVYIARSKRKFVLNVSQYKSHHSRPTETHFIFLNWNNGRNQQFSLNSGIS